MDTERERKKKLSKLKRLTTLYYKLCKKNRFVQSILWAWNERKTSGKSAVARALSFVCISAYFGTCQHFYN